MYHPFVDLINLKFTSVKDGKSICTLNIEEKHYNPNKVVHGAVPYAMADSGMGAALFSVLDRNKVNSIATVEIKMNYFKSVKTGELNCITKVIHCGKSLANLDSEIRQGELLIARANGTFHIKRNIQEQDNKE